MEKSHRDQTLVFLISLQDSCWNISHIMLFYIGFCSSPARTERSHFRCRSPNFYTKAVWPAGYTVLTRSAPHSAGCPGIPSPPSDRTALPVQLVTAILQNVPSRSKIHIFGSADKSVLFPFNVSGKCLMKKLYLSTKCFVICAILYVFSCFKK